MATFLQSLLVFMPAHPPSPFLEHISALHKRICFRIELRLQGLGEGVSRLRGKGGKMEGRGGFVDIEKGKDIWFSLIRIKIDERI